MNERIFLAHSAQATDEDIEAFRKKVLAHWPGAETMAGRDAFRQRFARAGGWDQWARYVVEERVQGSPMTAHNAPPRYTAFVAPAQRVGKATAAMLGHALRVGRPVYAMVNGTPMRARSVQQMEPDNFTSGWTLMVG